MGKGVAYVAGAVVFMGIGAIIAGLAVWFTVPRIEGIKPSTESRRARCVLVSSDSSNPVSGTVNFFERSEAAPVDITANISGLTPGLHGFHIHTYGVAGGDCKAAKGHFNPEGHNHAAPNATERHVGDLGNILASEAGVAEVDMLDDVITLWGQSSILGRSVMVHAGQDDLGLGGDQGSISTGNAGGRVACCTIFIVESE